MASNTVGEDKIRTFLALPLAEYFLPEITGVIREVSRGSADIKWVKPEQVHITLHFFGSISRSEIESVKKIVRSVASDSEPLAISLEGVGAFPDLDHPRVVWIGAGGARDRLMVVQKTIETCLAQDGFKTEDREFRPHATIGRIKQTRQVRLRIPDETARFKTGTKRMDRIILFQSQLKPEGPFYEPLETFLLSKEPSAKP